VAAYNPIKPMTTRALRSQLVTIPLVPRFALASALAFAWAFASATAAGAGADRKDTCLEAASKGQRLRDGHELIEARNQLRVCAEAGCPAAVQGDCAKGLGDVEKALPTVVIAAKDGAGVDLVDVKVSVDGEPFADRLDGLAMPMNPGLHTLRFGSPGHADAEEQVTVREGEKHQLIAVVLEATAPPQAGPRADTGVHREPAGRTVTWVLGGAGAAALGVGATFGLMALVQKNDAHCDANNVCDPGTAAGIKTAAALSDVGWIAGGILLGAAGALLLLAPDESAGHGAGVRLIPSVTPTGAGVIARASW